MELMIFSLSTLRMKLAGVRKELLKDVFFNDEL